MGQAKSLETRHKVVSMRNHGHTYSQIAETLDLGLGTVKNLCKRYSCAGDSGLLPLYHRCGRRISRNDEVSFRLVRLIRHLHPGWGVPLILLKISEKFPRIPLRSARQYQRRLLKGSGKLPPAILPRPIPMDRARTAHEVWQIDAKERFSLAHGQEACYLTISDEGTGALLGTQSFPPWAHRTGAHRTD